MGFNHHRNICSVLQIFLFTHCCFLGFITNAIDTITVNQSLHDSETLVSNGEKFKLGFFTPENSSYRYVGIMFNIPVTTVIWVANRETPLNDSSGTIQISGDGNLVILDGSRRIIWSSGSPSSSSLVNSNTTAVLLNTGNLVLQDHNDNSNNNNNNGYVWESFKHASDSFVANLQIFADSNTNETNTLTSWRSASDPGLGSFTLTMEPVGIPECFIWKNGDPFWRTGPWNGQIFDGIPNMNSVDKHGLDIVNSYDGTAYLSFKLLNSSVLVYYLLNSYGALQEKEWSEEKGEWVVNWSSSNNECDLYGKCGAFGSCNNQDSPICTCFPGFEPKVEDEWRNGNWSNGCSRKSALQCGRNGSVGGLGKQDGFLKMGRVKLPDRDTWFPTSEEECMSNCLSNCSCIAYSHSAGTGCMKWEDDLFDVQKFPNGVADLYIRLASSELGNKKDHKAIIASTVILGSITVVVFTFFMRKLLVKYRGGKKRRNELMISTTEDTDKGHSEESMLKHNVHGSKFEDLPLFKFQTLSDATDKFNSINKLGQGGFGPVYKGKLENGQEIAVKRLAKSSNQGIEEFMNEVEVISKLQHRNLVKLIGCCVECEEKMLVYEYMHNGSLNAHLFDLHKKEFLDWKTRAMIIEGICRGLLYLHRDSRLRIIHRDLKASNILLDDELNPKISDFGMARIFRLKEDEANTIRVVGTYGYMSPEYALHGIFSEKSDVYSLGILLLEIVSGRKNSSFYHEEQQLFLIEYVWELWNEEKMVNLIDPVISVPGMMNDIVRYANVGLLCVQDKAADRPNVSTVLSMLSFEIVELPRPKKPAFFGTQSSLETESSGENLSKSSLNEVSVTIGDGGR